MNNSEFRFLTWVKDQPCVECGSSPVIVDHMYGSAFIHNKVLIGHWAILPLCVRCDAVKTQGSANKYKETFNRTQAQAWLRFAVNYPMLEHIPMPVIDAIEDWNK